MSGKIRFIFTLFIVLTCSLVVIGTATTATQDKGRRLTGPFCIGKPYLRPLGADGTPIVPLRPANSYSSRLVNAKIAVLRAGVVRSVSAKSPCRPWENRRVGIAIPCKTLTPLKPDVYCKNVSIGIQGKPGPPGPAGKDGAAGTNGTNGKDGAAGAQGPAGAAGKVTVTQLTGSQSNCVQITGSDGSNGVICGAAGAPGPKGDPGPPGPKGDKGNTGNPGICECKGTCSIKDPKYQ